MAESGFSNYPSQYVLRENCWIIGQEVGNNRTLIGFQLFIDKKSGTGRWGNESVAWQFYLNSGAVSSYSNGAYSYDFRNYSTLTLIGNGQAWIGHNANGTQSLSIQGNAQFGQLGSAQVNSGFSLPTIPRASTPSWSGDFVAGTAKTIDTNRASSGFTHQLFYSFGSSGWVSIASGITNSVSWTPPLSLLQQIPNAASGTGTLRLRTFNGSTTIGDKDVAFTLTAPASAVPTTNASTISEGNATVASIIGAGAYVQKLSDVKAIVSGSGYQGSTISAAQFTIGSVTVDSGDTITPQTSGTIAVSSKVTDSRGRVATRSDNITVLAYSTPTINNFLVQRATSAGVVANEGTYLRVDLNAVVSSLVNGTQKNTLGIRMFTRLKGATSWTARNVINHSALTYNTNFLISGAPYAVNQAYEVRIEVFDKFSVAAGQTLINTAQVYMNWATGGVGINKYWQKGALDINGDVYSRDVLLSTPLGMINPYAGSTAPQGWLLCQGQEISRVTYADLYSIIGNTYGAGNGTTTFNLPNLKGRIPVGLDSAQTEFDALGETGGAKTHTLTVGEMPSHSHGGTGGRIWSEYGSGSLAAGSIYGGVLKATTAAAGNDQAHNNLQPYAVVNYIIKAI